MGNGYSALKQSITDKKIDNLNKIYDFYGPNLEYIGTKICEWLSNKYCDIPIEINIDAIEVIKYRKNAIWNYSPYLHIINSTPYKSYEYITEINLSGECKFIIIKCDTVKIIDPNDDPNIIRKIDIIELINIITEKHVIFSYKIESNYDKTNYKCELLEIPEYYQKLYFNEPVNLNINKNIKEIAITSV